MLETLELEKYMEQQLSQEQIRQKIYEIGAQEYLSALPDIKKAFENNRIVNCIDEGILDGLHLAGSGCLLNEEQLKEAFAQANPEGFTTHAGCGAWAKAHPEDKTPDQSAQGWGKKISELTGVPYKGHISQEQMHRPAGKHNAWAIYYDLTGKFNRASAENLPQGFVISAKDFPQSALDDLDLAIQIAFGHHGLGAELNEEQPLVIIPVGTKDLSPALQDMATKYGARVRFNPFEL